MTRREQFEKLLNAFEKAAGDLTNEVEHGVHWHTEHAAREARDKTRAELIEFFEKGD